MTTPSERIEWLLSNSPSEEFTALVNSALQARDLDRLFSYEKALRSRLQESADREVQRQTDQLNALIAEGERANRYKAILSEAKDLPEGLGARALQHLQVGDLSGAEEALAEARETFEKFQKAAQDSARQMRFRGTWSPSIRYSAGDVVLNAAFLWVANADTTDAVGTKAWTLIATTQASTAQTVISGAGGGGGAPTVATYLTATSDPDLLNEVVVGTTPGGELGGTWPAPTVAATHSGSAHHNKSHAHDGADGSGTVTHASTTGQGTDDHHAKSHVHSADGSGTVAHSSLSISSLDHHVTIVRKTQDETVNNSNSFQDDDELFFAIAANEIWFGEWWLSVLSVSVNSDFKYQFTAPSGASARYGFASTQSGGWGRVVVGSTPNNLDVLGGVGQAGSGALTYGLVIAGVFINGATPGNIKLQWAQNTQTAEDTKVLANSFVRAWRLA
jgi:hypothetical protein